MNFLKKGKAAQAMLAQDQARADANAKGRVFRFWMPNDSEGQITFLDGNLNDEGALDAPMLWEHQLKLNGHFRNWFPCTRDEEPCPICEQGDTAYFAAAFTIVDHRQWTDKQGKVHENDLKLFVCKRETYKILQKIAAKRGGLAGCTFDVSRAGEKSAGVGNMFDFVGKTKVAELCKAYKVKGPLNYEEALVYFTAHELRQQGLGSGAHIPGAEPEPPKPGKPVPPHLKGKQPAMATEDASDDPGPTDENYGDQM